MSSHICSTGLHTVSFLSYLAPSSSPPPILSNPFYTSTPSLSGSILHAPSLLVQSHDPQILLLSKPHYHRHILTSYPTLSHTHSPIFSRPILSSYPTPYLTHPSILSNHLFQSYLAPVPSLIQTLILSNLILHIFSKPTQPYHSHILLTYPTPLSSNQPLIFSRPILCGLQAYLTQFCTHLPTLTNPVLQPTPLSYPTPSS
jgi:hypothetical protein